MSQRPKKVLSLFDSLCLSVGIIVGVGIYESSPWIAGNSASEWSLLGFWLIGGGLSLMGAICYAELCTRYPQEGGDYVYLYHGLGPKVAFLYGWTKLSIIRPGSIAAMAFVFDRYMNILFPMSTSGYYALASVLVLGTINVVGVREGKWTQNILTTLKVLGIIFILVSAFQQGGMVKSLTTLRPTSWRLALIFVLFAFGGWNEIAYVAAEVKNPRKNIIRSLVLGTLLVTLLYIAINFAFVWSLGFDGLAESTAAASDVVRAQFGPLAERIVAALISISALGAINGMIFTGARISYAFGNKHRLFSFLGKWSPKLGTPVNALSTEALITCALILAFFGDAHGFESMVLFTTPVFWLFMGLVGMCLMRFRKHSMKSKQALETYYTPFFPYLPIGFIVTSLFMFYSSLTYAIDNWSWEVFGSLGIMALGFVFIATNGTQTAKK